MPQPQPQTGSKIVSIEGVGNVEFPASMDDGAINHAIETDILTQPGLKNAKNIPGTLAFRASKRVGTTTVPVRPTPPPLDTPGFGKSFAQSLGIPTSASEVPTAVLHAALPMVAPFYDTFQTASALHRARNIEDVNRVVNPLATPMEQAGEGNWGGLAGSVAGPALLAGVTAGAGKLLRSPTGTTAANIALHDLPEIQNLTRVVGSGVDELRGVHGPRGTARAGIVFDPSNPSKFVQDHEAAINHSALARDQLLAQPDGSSPSIATKVALDEISRAAGAARLSASEMEGVARLQNVIGRKGDLISASDLHNAVRAGGSNIPSSIRQTITPMIDANVPGYRSLGEHMGDLYEGKESAAGIVNRLRTGPSRPPSRVAAGVRAVGNAVRGNVIGAVTNAADALGGGGGVVDAKGLARVTKLAARAATRHAQSQGLFSANPSLNALRNLTAPESAEPTTTLASKTRPTALLSAPTGPEFTPGEWVNPQINPRHTLPSATADSITVVPSTSSTIDPFVAPRQLSPPFFWNELHGVKAPGSETVLHPEPQRPSLLRVPQHTPVPTPITEPPVISAVGSGVTSADHSAWLDRINTLREANTQANTRAIEVPKRVFRNISGSTTEIPVRDWMQDQVGAGASSSHSGSSPSSPPLIDQSFSKGEPVRYSVGDTQLRGRVMSDVRQSKLGPYVVVSSEPERGQYSILVSNLARITRKGGG